MSGEHSIQSPNEGGAPPRPWRESLQDAIRYWEPRRITYNLVLTAVVAAWVVATWPHFRGVMTLHSLLLLIVLAILANVCYCAAYLADIPLQRTLVRAVWQRRRSGLWLTGIILAIVLANY
ncbi:MAG TPA: hypothetical protein VNM68_07320 [Candidatus Polarisedimenticolia bacterium]|nr:hypothetical protein [Candidatus Polarisedimenticolia bacterium]